MNGKKTNLITDTEAVSGIIGAVLLMAIAVTMLTIFQASMVPYWNKQVEAAEIKVTYDDMMFLPSDIEDVTIHETPKTFTVQLGAHYPDRMIFRNPGPGAFGTLTVEEAPAPITVTYDNGSEYTEPYNSTRITYEMSGTINSPKLVYEHGVIITDWGAEGNLTTDEQKLIENDNIYIPIVNGASSSKSAIGVESLAIKQYEYLDTLGNISNVNVTLNTDYPELWENTLLSSSVLADLDFSGTVEFGSDKMYINTSVPYLKLPDQTASGSLHAGMISCTVEDPDGAGGGSGLWVAGEGTDIMAIGSRVAHIPNSTAVNAFTVEDILVDHTDLANLNFNFLSVTVTDDNLNWWKLIMQFGYSHGQMEIVQLDVVKKAGGGSVTNTYLVNGDPISGYPNSLVFTEATVIDLLNVSNFDTPPDALYQNANIGSDNRLVTNIFHKTTQDQLALIFFRLRVEGD